MKMRLCTWDGRTAFVLDLPSGVFVLAACAKDAGPEVVNECRVRAQKQLAILNGLVAWLAQDPARFVPWLERDPAAWEAACEAVPA